MSNRPEELRVGVSGLGVVSSIGLGRDEFWKGLISGKSGVSKITTFSSEGLATTVGGEVKDSRFLNYVPLKIRDKIGRASRLAVAATVLALEDAKLTVEKLRSLRVTIVIGTTMGESQVLESIDKEWISSGEGAVLPEQVGNYPGNVLALNIARAMGLQANCIVIPTACAAGNYAIGYAYDLIKLGKSDLVIAGGSDAFSRIALTGFSRMYAVAPEKCQPFDKNRKGIVVGEGSGVMVLESMAAAIERKAIVYAELIGYALSCDASHMTIPDEESIVSLINKTLLAAGISADEVDYISAHGTGTKQNDKTECAAINRVFGDRGIKVPVSSIKSMLGHTMGAASALEAIACIMAIHESAVPPTVNYEAEDPECGIDCIPNVARKMDVNIVMNNSFAFGGNNASTVFGRSA